MALVFDVTGPMAMFRKSYTTTSSVSFPFPPPTAIAGLLAAIVGYGNNAANDGFSAAYWRKMKGTRIGLAVLKKGVPSSHAINFSNTKDPQKNPRVQIKHQFVFSPEYQVYVSGAIESELRDHLVNGTFVYTPYLGVAYALAEIRFVGAFAEEPLDTAGPVQVDTVIPWKEGMTVDVLQSGGAFKERMPFRMNEERGLEEPIDVLYAASPDKPLLLVEKGEIHVSGCAEDTVAWFPFW